MIQKKLIKQKRQIIDDHLQKYNFLKLQYRNREMDWGKEEDFKVQRQNLIQNIRRQNRESQFNKRRNFTAQQAQQNSLQIGDSANSLSETKSPKVLIADEARRQPIEEFIKAKYFSEMFPHLVQLLYSNDILQKHHGIIGIRKILSLNDSPPIHLVFEHNILPLIIEFMKQNIYPHLRLQATWIISNIATGGPDDVQAIVANGIIPILISFLIENQPGISDQAIWAIGNLAGDSPAMRDKVIDDGGIDSVIHFINNTTNRSNLIQAAWALSNLCRGNPLPNYEKIYKALPILCKIITLNILDDQNLSDCLWAISYTIQGPKNRMNQFLESKAIKQIVLHSKNPLLSIATPSLRIMGTISTGNESQTQQLLDQNILQVFEELLQSKKSLVRREVCWILSNIAAGTRAQVDLLLDKENLIDKVLTLFELDSADIKRQICYIFGNMSFLGERSRVKNLLISKEVLRYYADCITQRNNYKLIETSLETLPMLFDFGEKMKTSQNDTNFVINIFLNYPGVAQSFEELQHLESQKIYEKALNIYERYFDAENDQHMENMVAEP